APVFWRCIIATSNASDRNASASPQAPERRDAVPRRWTLHGLNNGAIFGATYRGVMRLPRWMSYAIGHSGTWLAWRLMAATRAAIADNLRPIFPHESQRALERRARVVLDAYAHDVIDFLLALKTPDDQLHTLFSYTEAHDRLFRDLHAQGRGMIVVSGHYGNWE